jgi:glycyl-tRNA synthetase beta chain
MNYLLEIGTEEIPARFITQLSEDLSRQIKDQLEGNRLSFSKIKTFSTYRRLALIIEDLSPNQPDLEKELKGPPERIALNDDGSFSKAAEGFLKKNSTKKGFIREGYFYTNLFSKGEPTETILPNIIITALKAVHLPVSMKWGSNQESFFRPIHWIVSLLDEKVIPFKFITIKAGNKSFGHRFLSESLDIMGKPITITSATTYQSTLLEQKVVVSSEDRKKQIKEQLMKASSSVSIDDQLLHEVTGLTEFPTIVKGTFDPTFLDIPEKVLVTSMKKHQKYFPIYENNKLTHSFLIAAESVTDDNLNQIIEGNQRVLKARLYDAQFFFKEDSKQTFDFFLERLRHIVYQKSLGSVHDKVMRCVRLGKKIALHLQLEENDTKDLLTILTYQKADLSTNMVFEFADLQGYMGQEYAKVWGYNDTIAEAIHDHYKPTFAGDSLPRSILGAYAAIIDKIDTIVSNFSIGFIPTGSSDPYALRRQANGLLQIIEYFKIPITLDTLWTMVIGELDSIKEQDNLVSALKDFFILRVETHFKSENKGTFIKAACDLDLNLVKKRLTFLYLLESSQSFTHLIQSIKRIDNLGSKSGSFQEINEKLFEEEAERNLWSEFQDLKGNTGKEWDKTLIEALSLFTTTTNQFFDKVMVMVDDEKIKANRLNLLRVIGEYFKQFGDLKQIET